MNYLEKRKNHIFNRIEAMSDSYIMENIKKYNDNYDLSDLLEDCTLPTRDHKSLKKLLDEYQEILNACYFHSIYEDSHDELVSLKNLVRRIIK